MPKIMNKSVSYSLNFSYQLEKYHKNGSFYLIC